MKPSYSKMFNAQDIHEFIEEARRQYYGEHGNEYELIKNMGKAIAYTEARYAMKNITESEAHKLMMEAKAVIEEIIC